MGEPPKCSCMPQWFYRQQLKVVSDYDRLLKQGDGRQHKHLDYCFAFMRQSLLLSIFNNNLYGWKPEGVSTGRMPKTRKGDK